jgi:hypothetical protein
MHKIRDGKRQEKFDLRFYYISHSGRNIFFTKIFVSSRSVFPENIKVFETDILKKKEALLCPTLCINFKFLLNKFMHKIRNGKRQEKFDLRFYYISHSGFMPLDKQKNIFPWFP